MDKNIEEAVEAQTLYQCQSNLKLAISVENQTEYLNQNIPRKEMA